MAKENSKRLLAVDILRGITVAGMLLVNNPGSWGHLYKPLAHAEWIGLSPTDLVFPFFMFVMGVSMFFSLRKFDFKPSGSLMLKICRRTLTLFLIGWMVQWFGMWLRGLYIPNQSFFDVCFDHLRILGVFQRLALVYFFGSLVAVLVKQKFIPAVIVLILVVYALILSLGHGYDFNSDNILSKVDLAVLGEDHMYHEGANGFSLALDPEGILSTLPCIAHVLIGFMVGKILVNIKDNRDRVMKIAIMGSLMLLGGWLLQYGIPCAKKAWTSSYVLITCGMASCVLALLIYCIDIKGHDKWCRFFQTFGVNPLFCYLMGSILAIAFGAIIISESDDYVRGDGEKAVAMYQPLAADSCVEAQNNLAIALFNGKGVDENKPEAVKLLQAAAADSSMVKARYNLALAYMQDDDTTNDKEVITLLTEAADSSMTSAQFNLALCYDFGKFVEVDHSKALDYYMAASKQGLKRAKCAVNACYEDTVGATSLYRFDDVMLRDMSSCGAFEGDSLTAQQQAFNKVLDVAHGAGEHASIKAKAYEFCQDVTTTDEAASCLHAILFVLLNWCFDFILYKKKIYIKI